MNRVELLEKVKKQVEEKGTIRYKYVDGDCMCAVGYVLAGCGVNLNDFREDRELNSDPIHRVCNNHTDIHMALVDNGLLAGNLEKLQKANDENPNSADRKQAVIAVIDELIEDFTEADKERTI